MMNTLILEKRNNYGIVTMNRGKANPINMEMVKEMRKLIKDVEADDSIKGLIIAGRKRFFSAGLDVLELYHYDETTMAEFWSAFLKMVNELTAFSKPLISAITGHSPAGGCILAICSDYRVMAEGEFRIGLNEIPVGIVVPNGILQLYAFWIGKRAAYQNLMQGELMLTDKALSIGLIDEKVSEELVLEHAEKQMMHYLNFPEKVWQKTKRNLRRRLVQYSQVSEQEKKDTLTEWWNPESRKALEKLVNRLSPKKA